MEPTLSLAGSAALTILLLPLAAALLIALCPKRDPQRSANLSIGAIALGFVLSLGLFAFAPEKAVETNFNWLAVGDLKVSFGLLLDPLSKLMLLVVTGVGLMIHIYSRGYLHGDRSFSRYFASLSLFASTMPSRKPKSPTRFVRKAFFAASAAEFFSNQKPMSR